MFTRTLGKSGIRVSALGLGVLSGRWTRGMRLPQDDRRSKFFEVEEFLQDLEKIQAMRQVLTRDGRSYVQAALGWIWARSPRTIPVPGFRTIEHVEENARAMHFGPLNKEQMRIIQGILE
jgi:aryl-alcohol dehydrogenase-like predicted oxidoreductase